MKLTYQFFPKKSSVQRDPNGASFEIKKWHSQPTWPHFDRGEYHRILNGKRKLFVENMKKNRNQLMFS